MPMVINTNISSLEAQKNLNRSQGALRKSFQRLSSFACGALRGCARVMRQANAGAKPSSS